MRFLMLVPNQKSRARGSLRASYAVQEAPELKARIGDDTIHRLLALGWDTKR